MIQRMLRTTVAAGIVCAASTAGAAKPTPDDERFLDVRFLLQAWAQLLEEGAPDGESLGKELFLRRGRIILRGRVTESISFFFDTDVVNYGRDDFTARVFVQDAWATYSFDPALRIDAGLMIPPLVHHTNQGIPSMLSVDYHSNVIRFPAFSNVFMRDVGAQARGIVLGERLQYRAGVFGGVRGTPAPLEGAPAGAEGLNPKDALRLAGQLRFNVFEPETENFYDGIYFGEKRVLSFGVGGDWQSDAVRSAAGELQDYAAYGGDVFLDLPLAGDQELVAQVNVVRWDNGEDGPNTGVGWFAEAGWRVGAFSPIVSYERFSPDDAALEDSDAVRVTGAWWIDRLAANLKLEVASVKQAPPGQAAPAEGQDRRLVTTLQAQVLF